MSSFGNGHRSALHITQVPQRVVSLVPSLTESLFDLGFGNAVVGVTDYCVHPPSGVRGLPRLGGPKNARVDEIIALKPDLVLANQEENTKAIVEHLEAAGLKVWMTFPKNARQVMDVLWVLVGIFQSRPAAMRLETLEIALDWAESSLVERPSWMYFCPIWQANDAGSGLPEWWMTFNRHTYINDVLRLMGGGNVFADRERRYPLEADLNKLVAGDPGERDTRYPRVTIEEIIQANPAVILLPSEPFAFGEKEREQIRSVLEQTEAVQKGKLTCVDGSLLTWHGTRLARALNELPHVLEVL